MTKPVKVPVGIAARQWRTRHATATVLLVVHNIATLNRLADIVGLFDGDLDLQIVATSSFSDPFSAGLRERITDWGFVFVPWEQALQIEFDLIVAASHHGSVTELTGPIVIFSHGIGYAVVVFRRSTELARSTGDLVTVASGLEWQGIVTGRRGDLDEALTLLSAARAVVHSEAFPAGRRPRADALLSMHCARILAALSRHPEAEREATTALRYFDEHDEPGNVLRAALTFNAAVAPLGRTRTGTDRLRQALIGIGGRLLRPQQLAAWRAIAANERTDADPHAALLTLAHASELARALALVDDEAYVLLDEAALHAGLGDPGQAAQRLQIAHSRTMAALPPGAERTGILVDIAAAYDSLGDSATAAECRAQAVDPADR